MRYSQNNLEKRDGIMWFFVIIVVIIIVVVIAKKGGFGRDIRETPQYRTFRNILDALEESGFKAKEFSSSGKQVTSSVEINGQCVANIWVTYDGSASRIARYEELSAKQNIGDDAVGDLFDLAYCHEGNLAYWSELPKDLTPESASGLLNEKPINAWVRDSSEATGIVFPLMRGK